MTKIIPQIVDAIHRHNHINIVIVSKVEWLLIKRELSHMSNVKRSKRPTGDLKSNPWLYSDQLAWDAQFKQWRDYSSIEILGRQVIYRSVGK